MKNFRTSLLLASAISAMLAACGGGSPQQQAMAPKLLASASVGATPSITLTYDTAVRTANPVMYLSMSTPQLGTESDLANRGHLGAYRNKDGTPAALPGVGAMPNGDSVAVFDGLTQFLRVEDQDDLSIPTTGYLTLEAWIRPDVLQFPDTEGGTEETKGYVHWMGKGNKSGATGNQEYVARMYSFVNEENRPNRISGYAFNLVGDKGSGAYFLDRSVNPSREFPVTTGAWIHYVLILTNTKSAEYPDGYARLYRNGVLNETRSLNQPGVAYVIPGNGNAPFQIASRDGKNSFFKGAIGKIAIYNRELDAGTIAQHYSLMCAGATNCSQ
ncbi:MAG TPA: LamG domain-containing protein [Burkholderiaceae bacterium]